MERASCCRNSPHAPSSQQGVQGTAIQETDYGVFHQVSGGGGRYEGYGDGDEKSNAGLGVAGVVAGNLLQGVGGVGPHHDELAVGQVDDVH